MPILIPGAPLGASYRLSERIGSGAAGDVWRVESTSEDAFFAAKILKAEHADDPALVERFIRERSVLIGLRHANIVAVRDLVVEGEIIAIVMDFVSGGSLRELLASRVTLPPSEALHLTSEVFAALAAAHAIRITHRDIKPDNVLLTRPWAREQEGTVRVADFGIASVMSAHNRQTTGLLGTPQYMAPELISHGQTSPAVDVYSAGILLYELLSGRTPFAGPGTDFTIAYRHVTTKPPPLNLPAPIVEWLDLLLSKDPRQRPAASEAATHAQRLATRFSEVPALVPTKSIEFEEIERPATVLRSDLMVDNQPVPEPSSLLADESPVLGEAGQHTTVRPMPQRAPVPLPEVTRPDNSGHRELLTRKNILLGAAGIALLAGMVAGLFWLFGNGSDNAKVVASETLEATQEDTALPTGLSVARKAIYNPESQQVTLELKYSAQKSPLSGTLLEIIPPVDGSNTCPPVTWAQESAKKHQSSTGLKVTCGWKLEKIEIPANGQTSIAATFPATIADGPELNEWLSKAASATQAAITDSDAVSTEYPAQRIIDLNIKVPARTVGQVTLPIAVVPVWPSGPDELNPVYRSPATGSPTQMLKDIAGSESGVRFSDSCAGAVAVSSDGLVVTTLTPTTECRIHASIGNFTSLQSSPFSITTRE